MKRLLGLMMGLLCGFGVAGPRPNVLLICIDDLRPELNCYGVDYIHSPNIDRLAQSGLLFKRHFVNAPSCGPSRYALLTGLYPVKGAGNEFLRQRAERLAEQPGSEPPSMPEWFKNHGYTTVSVGKVSHYPGGRFGSNWEGPAEMPGAWDRHLMPCGDWEHPKGAMHGYANGKQRLKPGNENFLFESVEGPDRIFPDGLITEEGLNQLEQLAAADRPFFLAIGLIKPHLPFGAPARYMEPYRSVTLPPIPHPAKPEGLSTWHPSREFMSYQRWGKDPNEDAAFAEQVRKHYAACVSYADKHVGDILRTLAELGADRNTIVILWGDHGWHLGEHGIWGKHSLFEESLHAPLIIRVPGMKEAGKATEAIVQSVDLFPTLCGLAGLPLPRFAQGKSIEANLEDAAAAGGAAIALWTGATIRTATHRLIRHGNGRVELYDHRSEAKETENVASRESTLVSKLMQELEEGLAGPE